MENLKIDNSPQDMISMFKDIVGENEYNYFKNIESLNSNVAQIPQVLANSGEKILLVILKEIDEEIEEHKKRNFPSSILDGSENLRKLKDKVEVLEKFYCKIFTIVNVAIAKGQQLDHT